MVIAREGLSEFGRKVKDWEKAGESKGKQGEGNE